MTVELIGYRYDPATGDKHWLIAADREDGDWEDAIAKFDSWQTTNVGQAAADSSDLDTLEEVCSKGFYPLIFYIPPYMIQAYYIRYIFLGGN